MKNLAPWLFLAAVAVGGYVVYRRYGASILQTQKAPPMAKPMSTKKMMNASNVVARPKADPAPAKSNQSSSAISGLGSKSDMSASHPTVNLSAARQVNALTTVRPTVTLTPTAARANALSGLKGMA